MCKIKIEQMKFNWGYKIAAVYITFVVGMMYLVIRSSQQEVDLVTPDYYAQELKYQDRIDELNRAAALSTSVQCSIEQDVITVAFPPEFSEKKITGQVLVYCAADKGNDINSNISVNNGQAKINVPEKNSGMHEVQVSWESEGVKYYSAKTIFIP
jgi:hypothetical protein